MTTRLTAHFTLEELTTTRAVALGMDNTPPANVLPNLLYTAKGLEEVRALVGGPISVTSGYRSPSVNAWAGSKPTSQHLLGQAADFHSNAFTTEQLMSLIYKSKVKYDQLLREFADPKTGAGGWVHISFSAKPRMQALIIDKQGVRPYAG